MNSSRYLRIVVNVALVLMAVLLAVVSGQRMSETLKWVSRVGAGVFLLAFIFENLVWRWSWLQRWSWFPVPDLNGTWKGTLVSSYVRDGEALEPLEAYIVVRQSFLNISVRQFTAESASTTLVSSIRSDADGVKHLNVTYFNSPDLQRQAESRAHSGTFDYCVEGHPASELAGSYWTSRATFGDARLSQRISERANNFEHARQLFAATSAATEVQPANKVQEV